MFVGAPLQPLIALSPNDCCPEFDGEVFFTLSFREIHPSSRADLQKNSSHLALIFYLHNISINYIVIVTRTRHRLSLKSVLPVSLQCNWETGERTEVVKEACDLLV